MSIQQNFPAITPSLSLNFARSKTLDPRITFSRTSTATRVNEVGLIEVMSADEPRFDHEYDSSTGAVKSLGLLVEESRSNLLTYSEDFTQWVNTNTTDAVDTSITAPDGTNTATKITDDSTNAAHNVKTPSTTNTGTTFTFSCFVKKGDFSYFIMVLRMDANSENPSAKFDFDNPSNNNTYGSGTNKSQTVTEYPNGWYHISLTSTFGATVTSVVPHIHLTSSDGNVSYSGSGNFNYIWGAQLEAGAFPTSYISTSGSTVTRNPDNVSMTGTNFSDWYNQDAGTVYVSQKLRAVQDTNRNNLVYLINGGSENDYFYNPNRGNTNIFVFGDGGTNYSRFQDGTNSIDTKTAFAYDVSGDDFKPYYNGIESTTETTTNTPSATSHTQLELGATAGIKYCGHIQQFTYYPRRLTNTQLQNLTK
jgi:hypothetical protein